MERERERWTWFSRQLFFSTANMQHRRCIIIHQTWTLTVTLLWTKQILRLYKVCRQFVQVISIFLYLFISLSPFLFLSLTLPDFVFSVRICEKKIGTVKERGRDWEGMGKNWKEEMGGGMRESQLQKANCPGLQFGVISVISVIGVISVISVCWLQAHQTAFPPTISEAPSIPQQAPQEKQLMCVCGHIQWCSLCTEG